MYTYVVGPWDTLDSIAYRFGVPVWTIMHTNAIYDPSVVCPGMVLRIPAQGNYPAPGYGYEMPAMNEPPMMPPFMPPMPMMPETPMMPTMPMFPQMPEMPMMPPYCAPTPMPVPMPTPAPCPEPMPPLPPLPVPKPIPAPAPMPTPPPAVPEKPKPAPIEKPTIPPPGKGKPIGKPSTPGVVPPLGTIDYTVQPGDTVYQIAKKYNTTMYAIIKVNNLANPELIYPGQVLKIPVSPPEAIIYTVKPGDSLYKIAQRYGTSVENIVKFNYIENPSLIYPGQQLIIPASLKG